MRVPKFIVSPLLKFGLSLYLILSAVFNNLMAQLPCTPPTASISLVSPSVCQGGQAYLQLGSASGVGPYNLTINGTVFSNISVGQQFGPFHPSETTAWNSTDFPATADYADGQPVELGTKIRTAVNGYITGVKFYKGVTNTGVHTASLWAADGTLLAKADFTGESASGWQELRFSSPVPVLANTTYTVSYFSPTGVYALNTGYFTNQGQTTGPLSAIQTGIDGPNGMYRYGGGFPTESYSDNNYWVDAIFTQSIATSTATYTLTDISDANGCSNSGTLSTATITVNALPRGNFTATLGACTGRDITLNMNASSGTGPYSVVINSSTYNGVNSNQPFQTTITGAPPTSTPVSIWSSGALTGSQTVTNDTDPVELGVKFKASITGSVTGMRFYKPANSTGAHTASLWTTGGTLLGTATFTNETASGWQEVSFAIPIAITANQTFIASYFSEGGQYIYSQNFFSGTGVSNGPLSVPQSNSTDGGNGVYQYGGGLPSGTFNDNNYWVDVIFTASQGSNLINVTTISDANGCTTSGTPIQSLNIPSAQCIPLPVTLVNFRLGVQEKKIKLQWETASENNNRGFDIQRSTNGAEWNSIGFVNGAGTSSLTNYYSFTDGDLASGHYYYRLKQIDLDNNFKVSGVLSGEIKGGPQNYLGQNYPNPAAGVTVITYSLQQQANVNLSLYDVYGRLLKVWVNQKQIAGKYTINADLQALNPGTYYYRISSGNFNDVKKLVVGNR